ncbi:MAG TPA: 30S ribosomal protein S20 [Candidatus Limnocylindrales bacterium]|nr:30S ribosomal protein S20 [Candidatus Limnocylindrales bacterium]
MAKRTASAKKQARAGAKRTVRNRAVRSEVKTLIVKARRALSDGAGGSSGSSEDRVATTVEAVRALDRAASKRVLHRNNASRRKSRLAKRLAKLAAAAPAPSAAAPARGNKAAPAAAPAKKK